MNPQGAQTYLRTKVLTATPEQLQMLLYEGALRFGEQGRAALAAKKYDESYQLISKVQKIVAELTCGLKREVSPELCGKLASLYNYVYRKLIAANVEHDLASMDEALNVLRYQRETWGMLMAQLGKTKAAAAAQNIAMPGPNSRMEASISMQG